MSTQASVMSVTSFDLSKAVTFSKIFSKIKLSPSARLILRCLIDFYNPNKGLVYPGQKTIAECTGAGEKTITNAVNELRSENLILTTKKGTSLNYHFSNKFFELVGFTDNTRKNYVNEPANFTDTCIEQKNKEQIKNKKNVFSFKTDFHAKYADVLDKLSEYDLEKYKMLKGYEKEDWLLAKRKSTYQQQFSMDFKVKTEEDKQNTGSPLDLTQDQAIEYLNNLPAILNNSFFAQELRKKWKL